MITVFGQAELDDKLRKSRRERYACQSVAKMALPDERVSKCLRFVLNQSQVQIWKHLKTQKSFYNGLMVCGSVWNCPVCASKISEKRRKELKQAFDLHNANKGHIALLTLTFRHKKNDRLKDTLKNFTSATSKFRSGKRYQKIRDNMDIIGTIRVFEITYGKNGFHPHIHIAIFYKNKVDLNLIKNDMFDLWQKACKKFGLSTLKNYGLDLEDGEKANDYLSKHGTWGLDRELSKSHIKEAKQDSYTPFDFLRWYLITEDKKYLRLFKEYAEALKGKTQLYWSRGLKIHFNIGDKTDEELSKEKLEDADLLGLLTMEEWKLILKNNYRAKLLDNIEKFGFDFAKKIIIDKFKKEVNQTSDLLHTKNN